MNMSWLRRLISKPQPISFANLHDPKRYEHQIQKVFDAAKDHRLTSLFKINYKKVPLFAFGFDKHNAARALAAAVRSESYFLEPAEQRIIVTGADKGKPKERVIYEFSLLDKIVGGVVAQLLTEIVEPFRSPHTYAYRKGVSTVNVVNEFSRYIKQTYAENPSVKGLYIIKADIKDYTDSINLSGNSSLWPELQTIFSELQIVPTSYQQQLIQSCIRPVSYNLEGRLESSIRGIPTGAAITAFLYNFYTMIVDRKISATDKIFYARYCDDLLLAHHDADVLLQTDLLLKQTLEKLELERRTAKDLYCYLNRAGNVAPDLRWQGANKFLFLGYRIHGDGNFSISKLQQRTFFRDLQKRITSSYHTIKDLPLQKQGKMLCRVVNRAIQDKLLAQSSALNLLRYSTDYGQLKHLDHSIALKIAETLSHQHGPRAFRAIPYRKIRSEWGLLSLLQLSLKKHRL